MSTRNRKTEGTDAIKLMLAYLCVNEVTGLADKVATLDRFGLLDYELALVCGVDERAIRDSRYKRKRRNSKPAQAKKGLEISGK